MYTFCIVVILLASVSLIFVVLVQSPKGGMAANFGAANQVMGVRDAANGLEKFTWAVVASPAPEEISDTSRNWPDPA